MWLTLLIPVGLPPVNINIGQSIQQGTEKVNKLLLYYQNNISVFVVTLHIHHQPIIFPWIISYILHTA